MPIIIYLLITMLLIQYYYCTTPKLLSQKLQNTIFPSAFPNF